MVALHDERRAWVALIAWQRHGHQVAAPQGVHPVVSAAACQASSRARLSGCSAARIDATCRAHAAAKPAARVSGTQTWIGRNPAALSLSRRRWTRAAPDRVLAMRYM